MCIRDRIIVVALLVVQAWCDLSLPAYTSDIIDVGIQNKGVEHVLPEAVTEDEFTLAQLFMTDEEKESWENSYEKDGDVYRLTVTDKKQLDELDDTLLLPLLMNYQMSSVDEQTFKESVAKQTGMDQAMLDNMSIEQIGESMGAVSYTHLDVYKRQDLYCRKWKTGNGDEYRCLSGSDSDG